MKTGSEFLRSVVELFHDLYTNYKEGLIEHEEILKVGGAYILENILELLPYVEEELDIDPHYTIGVLLDVLVDTKVLERYVLVDTKVLERYVDGNKVIYKPHNQFDEVLKNGKF
jgi:hypothetical protein